MGMMFTFGLAGLDNNLNNIIVLKSPIVNEFVGKIPNLEVTFKSNKGDTEEEEND
jgi:hypothetical protein